eukprot:COSAG02_NODE_40660_length_402_cov_324.735974_1_plen_89_part_10
MDRELCTVGRGRCSKEIELREMLDYAEIQQTVHTAHTATQVSSLCQVRGGSREAPTQVRRAKPRHAARGTARFGAPCLERGRPFTARGM